MKPEEHSIKQQQAKNWNTCIILKGADLSDNDRGGIGDGIPDIFETEGMRLANGQVIYTDPEMMDTDCDGLEDGIEINCKMSFNKDDTLEELLEEYSLGELVDACYFKMSSNPTLKDSDGDGVNDYLDPWECIYHNFDSLNNYVTRENWGAKKVNTKDKFYEGVNDPIKFYDTIIIHRTTRNQYEDIRSLEENEIRDGFNGMPYHFVISGDGTVYQCKPMTVKGEHVAKNNTGKIGVALMGNFEPSADGIKYKIKGALPTFPAPEQLKSMELLIKILKTQYYNSIYLGGHNDYTLASSTQTVCPGQYLYNYLSFKNLINLNENEMERLRNS